ncbi:MAG TPA: Rad52/Rad22 family DNA repair protein, partial [Terriglobales bacterium]
MTNTANNRTRGQVVPYADPRAYTDRLNALVSPQGWTRTYETVTMNNITRTKRNAEIVTGKILVTCKVTIDGLGTHSGTGEEWADEGNAMTSAEAQAFKRACSCFGLGRYFYDFDAPWVDIDDKSRPKKSPALAPWMVPENWRKGQRPSGRVAASSQAVTLTAGGSNSTITSNHRNGNGSSALSSATSSKSRQNASSNGSPKEGAKRKERPPNLCTDLSW